MKNESHSWPAVSVVIITRGRHASAVAAARSVLDAGYPAERREVIIWEETDMPEPIEGDGIAYHPAPVRNLGFGYARNRAIEHAAHDILVFTDDDCRVHANWLCEIVRPLRDDVAISAVAGAVRVPVCGVLGKCENILGFPGGGLRSIHRAQGCLMPCKTFSTCNCAVRRDALVAAGGFDESLRHGGEDDAVSRLISARGRVVFNPLAVVEHVPRDSVVGVFRWFMRRGRAWRESISRRGVSCWKMADLLLRFQTVRIAFLLGVCLLTGWNWFFWSCVAGAGLIYYTTVIWRRRWALRYGMPFKALLLTPLVKLVMDVGMEIGFYRGGGR